MVTVIIVPIILLSSHYLTLWFAVKWINIFCFIHPSIGSKLEFQYIENGLLISMKLNSEEWFKISYTPQSLYEMMIIFFLDWKREDLVSDGGMVLAGKCTLGKQFWKLLRGKCSPVRGMTFRSPQFHFFICQRQYPKYSVKPDVVNRTFNQTKSNAIERNRTLHQLNIKPASSGWNKH